MENRKKILITGGGGLVGSRVVELLSDKYELMLLGRSAGFDVSNRESFDLIDTSADYLLHLAAKTDVDGCEAEKELGERSEAWKINVNGTKNVAEFCEQNDMRMIYISTDFVFDGKKNEGDYYAEEDSPNPVNFYALTKYEGEKAVQESGADFIILRIAYPYRKEFDEKKDFMRAILDRLSQNMEVRGITDHIMCPTFIDDIAIAIDTLIDNDAKGIYHGVGSSPISPYDAAVEIADVFGLDKDLIIKTTRDEYFNGKAKRPFNLYLRNARMENLGIKTKTFREGLLNIKNS